MLYINKYSMLKVSNELHREFMLFKNVHTVLLYFKDSFDVETTYRKGKNQVKGKLDKDIKMKKTSPNIN